MSPVAAEDRKSTRPPQVEWQTTCKGNTLEAKGERFGSMVGIGREGCGVEHLESFLLRIRLANFCGARNDHIAHRRPLEAIFTRTLSANKTGLERVLLEYLIQSSTIRPVSTAV